MSVLFVLEQASAGSTDPQKYTAKLDFVSYSKRSFGLFCFDNHWNP